MKSNKFLVLASSSKSRLQLLKNVNIEPDLITSPDIDESPFPKEKVRPYCHRIAAAKLPAAFKKLSEEKKIPVKDYIIITADTMAACGRRLLHKSHNAEQIRTNLKLVSGRRHKVFTSVCCGLVEDNQLKKVRQKTVMTIVKFKRFTDKEINELVASKQGEGSAGNYTLTGIANKYLQFLSGSYSSVIGLPLYETAQLLSSFGYDHTYKLKSEYLV